MKRKLSDFRPGANVTKQEIQDVLANPGYSAGERKGWLTTLLTDITQEHSRTPTQDKADLIEDVKRVLDSNQRGQPKADDVL